MRILYVTDFYHPYTGGVENHVRTIAMEFARRGHEVAVATLTATPGQPGQTTDGPITVYQVEHSAQRIRGRSKTLARHWAPPFPDPLAMRQLSNVVSDFKPDLIHGHDWLARSVQPASVSGTIPLLTTLHYYTRTCAKKTLWRHGTLCDGPELRKCISCSSEHYGPTKGTAVALGVRVGARIEDSRSLLRISVSAATEQGNGLTGKHRSTVIPNPVTVVDADDGSDETKAAIAEVEAVLPEDDFILFVGDIRVEKGLPVLTDAVNLLRDRGVNTPLVVVGERMNKAIGLPANTIEVGSVPHAVVHHLFGRATVGVVPSQWTEPFGLVAVEGLAAGCPLVASDIGGLSEILADDIGVLVPVGDVKAMADAIDKLLVNPEKRREMSQRGRESVSRYALGTVVDELERRYRQATGS